MKNEFFNYRDKCPACHSKNFKEVYKSPFDEHPIRSYLEVFYAAPDGGVEFEYLKNASYHLCECKECNLIFQKEILNDYLMELLYDKWIDPILIFNHDQDSHNLERAMYYASEISMIIDFFDKMPSELSFFDFGMGWGKWALMVKSFGCKTYGTELSEERIKYATSNGIQVITWEEMPSYSFDFINTEQVFEHIPNPLETLNHLKLSLKPNGIIKISVPTANNIKSILKKMDWKAERGSKNSLMPVAPLEHINYYRRISLVKMAEKAGLKEVMIPMKLQYRYKSNWNGSRRIAKNLALPIYRNILKKQNYLFFGLS